MGRNTCCAKEVARYLLKFIHTVLSHLSMKVAHDLRYYLLTLLDEPGSIEFYAYQTYLD
jgi:hypothetical protein